MNTGANTAVNTQRTCRRASVQTYGIGALQLSQNTETFTSFVVQKTRDADGAARGIKFAQRAALQFAILVGRR